MKINRQHSLHEAIQEARQAIGAALKGEPLRLTPVRPNHNTRNQRVHSAKILAGNHGVAEGVRFGSLNDLEASLMTHAFAASRARQMSFTQRAGRLVIHIGTEA